MYLQNERFRDFIFCTKSEYQMGDFKNLNYFRKNSSFYLIDNPCLLSQMFILMLPRRKQYCKTTATAQLTSDLTSQHHFLIWPPFKYAKWGNLGCYRKKSSTIALYAGIYAFQHSANYGASMIIMVLFSLLNQGCTIREIIPLGFTTYFTKRNRCKVV